MKHDSISYLFMPICLFVCVCVWKREKVNGLKEQVDRWTTFNFIGHTGNTEFSNQAQVTFTYGPILDMYT